MVVSGFDHGWEGEPVITTNSAWDTKNAALGKTPIYVFAIGGRAKVYTTHNLLAYGITGYPTYLATLKTPRGASQSIDVVNGSSSIGELECEVVEYQGDLLGLVGTTTLDGLTATLSVGYPGMAYANFVALTTYQIYKVIPSKNYTSWLFKSRDRQMNQKKTIWTHPENGLALDDSNPWILQGTPCEIVQAIHLFALGRAVAELDRTTFLALDSAVENLHATLRPFYFVLDKSFEAKEFLESQIYKCCGVYPVVDNVGRLSLRAFRSPMAGPTPLYTFDEDNMTILPEVDRMPIINEIVFKIDADASDYKNELVFADATSLSLYGRTTKLSIDSAGLKTVLGAQWWCEEVASRIFRRFSGSTNGLRGGAPVFTIEAFFLTAPVWVGDFVYLTHPSMPDILTGTMGVTNRLVEVISRDPDYAQGKMKYKLLDTGMTSLQAAHLFSSSARNFVIGTSEVF